MKLPENFEQYIKQQIEDGYIKENGFPLKCLFCNSSDLNFKNKYQEEVEVTCNKCGKEIGYWAYGNWLI